MSPQVHMWLAVARMLIINAGVIIQCVRGILRGP